MKMIHATRVPGDRPLGAKPPKTERSRGQILILFVMAIFVFTGMVALVIDVSWYWVNSLRVQRAADAAALAGVVQLPTNPDAVPGGAFALAKLEATKNGYTDTVGGVTVTPVQDPPVTGRRLIVTVSAPVDMFFMRIFGINSITSTRTSKAEFVLPVPMGSPDNYYGVFGLTRGLTTSTTVAAFTSTNDGPRTTPWMAATSAPLPASQTWTRSHTGSGNTMTSMVAGENDRYAQTNVTGAAGSWQQWGDFDLLSGLSPSPPLVETATTVSKIEVELIDAHLSAACTGSTIRVALSYDGGATTVPLGHWTSNVVGPLPAGNVTPNLGTSPTAGDYSFGTVNMAPWPLASPAHTWMGNDLGNSNFRVRLTAIKGTGTGCGSVFVRVDQIRVRATYQYDTYHPPVTTTTPIADEILRFPNTACPGITNCFNADGTTTPNPNGFWGTMNTQGANSVNGDAYQPWWDTAPSATNPNYDADNFYNYAVEMPVGASGGEVYVYDPVFCATTASKGTGDRWFSGAGGDPVSSFYELYDTDGTLYDPGDDDLIATSGTLFTNSLGSDTTMGGSTSPGVAACNFSTNANYGDARDYHNKWYRLASGLAGGKVYRVHTTSTDPSSLSAQQGTDGENSFALYTRASGGTPRIYGIGAMQAFTPLSSDSMTVETTSEFYLAQIEAVHAGKTVEIKLWDPGDTKPLRARLQILVPNSGGWTATSMTWTAAQGTSNSGAATCGVAAAGSGTAITTNVGDTDGTYNGCWLTIQIPIPAGYTAEQDGWWKIRYLMRNSGAGTDTSNDVTTWKVEIRGNPVHLIVP